MVSLHSINLYTYNTINAQLVSDTNLGKENEKKREGDTERQRERREVDVRLNAD